MRFDDVDVRILQVLREDGRVSHASLAKTVGLSPPSVRERVRKLEQAGVIRGYGAVIDADALGLPVTAFVMVAPQPRHPARRLADALAALPEVEAIYSVAGVYSFMAMVRARSTAELDDLLDRVFMLEGVERTETVMVLRTALERPVRLPSELADAGGPTEQR